MGKNEKSVLLYIGIYHTIYIVHIYKCPKNILNNDSLSAKLIDYNRQH